MKLGLQFSKITHKGQHFSGWVPHFQKETRLKVHILSGLGPYSQKLTHKGPHSDLPNLSENMEIFVFFIHSPWSPYAFSNLRNRDFVNSACMTCNLRVCTYRMYHACGSLLLAYHVSVLSKSIHMRAIIESCRLFNATTCLKESPAFVYVIIITNGNIVLVIFGQINGYFYEI